MSETAAGLCCIVLSAGAPTQLLSRAAVLVSQAAIDGMLAAAAARALTLRLVDVTHGANISHHLREWAGDYVMTADGPDSFVITFTNPKSLKAASDTLAGGIRGLFRVERAPGSAAAAAALAAAGSTGGGWGPSSSSRTGAAGVSSSSSKASTKPGPSTVAAAGGMGWQVMSSSKSRSAAAATAAAPPPDPWADDEPATTAGRGAQRSTAAAAGAGAMQSVAEDWELALDTDVAAPARPALKLDQQNMWAALDDDF